MKNKPLHSTVTYNNFNFVNLCTVYLDHGNNIINVSETRI